jgi:hypothetical protein
MCQNFIFRVKIPPLIGIFSGLFNRHIYIFHPYLMAVTELEGVLFKRNTLYIQNINYWGIKLSISNGFSHNSFQ